MLIEAGKRYLTRDGHEVLILATGVEGLSDGSVVGVQDDELIVWYEDGGYIRECINDYDLMRLMPKTESRVVYLNLYPGSREAVAHCTKEAADRYADSNRIACKRLEFEYEHGEGL